ncbi:aminodeoxychorismate lyase [Alteromonas facilis]|uniref:aminodeoxychorismate lyase n=1 Tax=Alteromonas facilis TaxID=2048004 RepID=UPI000C290A41|nr:aminodeoxychorismate lyase [Alteromonas facilis]
MSESDLPFGFADRALNYGDGCFTTIAVIDAKPELLTQHFQRLAHDADKLNISLKNVSVVVPQYQHDVKTIQTTNWKESLVAMIKQVLSVHATKDLVVKALISRGRGGRGYSPVGCDSTSIMLTVHSFPAEYKQMCARGIDIAVAQFKLARQPYLAGIKHLNRLEQVLIKQELSLESDVDDYLVCDQDDCVIEASAANVFWLDEDNRWCTPALSHAGVNGVFRQFMLEYFRAQEIPVEVDNFTVERLNSIESAFICNALMQIMPVKSLRMGDGNKRTLDIKPIIMLGEKVKKAIELNA